MIKFDIQRFAKAVCNDKRTLEMFRYMVNNAYLRVINYNALLKSDLAGFDAEMEYYSQHFTPVTLEDLDEFYATRKWPKEKPGLVLNLYGGYRCHYDLMAPIIEKYGFTAWFHIPGYFLDVPVEEQAEYASQNLVMPHELNDYPDGRIAMTWAEVAELARRHEVSCQAGIHFRITKQSGDADLRREIVDAKLRIERKIDRPIRLFSWRYGEDFNHNIRSHKFLEEAGYQYVLSNIKMEKIY